MRTNIFSNMFFSLVLIGSLTFMGCGNNKTEINNKSEITEHQQAMEHDHDAHHLDEKSERNVSSNSGELKGDMSQILENYFSMNNYLAKDDAKAAANSSSKLKEALQSFNAKNLSEKEQQEVNDILESAIENAEHISENANKIDHQREHLVSLSEDIRDLIAIIGTSQKLYEDFCPMANDNQGAIWISNVKEINNPYMGTKMPTCGKVNRIIE